MQGVVAQNRTAVAQFLVIGPNHRKALKISCATSAADSGLNFFVDDFAECWLALSRLKHWGSQGFNAVCVWFGLDWDLFAETDPNPF